MFDLRDEYTLYDRSTALGYPNCAPDLETAEAWWGDLDREVDPWSLTSTSRRSRNHDLFFVDRGGTRSLRSPSATPEAGATGMLGSDEAVRPTASPS